MVPALRFFHGANTRHGVNEEADMSSTVLELTDANSDERPALAQRYDVMSVPTILVFSQGELRQRMVGVRSRSRLLEELAPLLSP